jgi:hypothetical protein
MDMATIVITGMLIMVITGMVVTIRTIQIEDIIRIRVITITAILTLDKGIIIMGHTTDLITMISLTIMEDLQGFGLAWGSDNSKVLRK